MSTPIVPRYLNGYKPTQYIHYTWDNFKKNVFQMPEFYGGNPPTRSIYLQLAEQAEMEFKTKFKVDPETASRYHEKLQEIYKNPAAFETAMNRAVENLKKDIKEAGVGMKSENILERALQVNTTSSSIQKKAKEYVNALEKLLNVIASFDQTLMSAKIKGSKRKINVTKGTYEILKNNHTALSSYINLRNSLKALNSALNTVRKGNSSYIIAYDKYRTGISKQGKLYAELLQDSKQGAVPIEQFVSSVEQTMSCLIGEYAEFAMLNGLKEGLSSIFNNTKIVGNKADSQYAHLKVEDDKGLDVTIDIRKTSGGQKSRINFETSTVGSMIRAWEATGVSDVDVYQYFMLNATAHSFLGHDSFSRRSESQMSRILQFLAAMSANHAIGQHADYVFYGDQVISKGELLRGMADGLQGYRRLMYSLGSASFSQGEVNSWYQKGMLYRLGKLYPRVLAVKLKIES